MLAIALEAIWTRSPSGRLDSIGHRIPLRESVRVPSKDASDALRSKADHVEKPSEALPIDVTWDIELSSFNDLYRQDLVSVLMEACTSPSWRHRTRKAPAWTTFSLVHRWKRTVSKVHEVHHWKRRSKRTSFHSRRLQTETDHIVDYICNDSDEHWSGATIPPSRTYYGGSRTLR